MIKKCNFNLLKKFLFWIIPGVNLNIFGVLSIIWMNCSFDINWIYGFANSNFLFDCLHIRQSNLSVIIITNITSFPKENLKRFTPRWQLKLKNLKQQRKEWVGVYHEVRISRASFQFLILTLTNDSEIYFLIWHTLI